MRNDLRFALRTLRRSPAFTLIALISLALGIGANTAIFSLLDQTLLRSLPVAGPERLVVFHAESSGPGMSSSDNNQTVFSYPMYRDLRDRSRVFSGVIARAGVPANVLHGGASDRAGAELVSGNFFQTLGVRAYLGRTITPEDDGAPGERPVTVLSHGYWMRSLGGDPAVLNQSVTINGYRFTVVGILGEDFRGLVSGQTPDLYVPIAMKRQMTPGWDGLKERRVMWLNIFARLNDRVSIPSAEAAMQVVFKPILIDEANQLGGGLNTRSRARFVNQKLEIQPAAQGINQLRASWEQPLVAVMAMVGLVLLIACVNVANLLVARAAGRQRELSIRFAVGATRWGVIRQLLTESLLLSLAGGLMGVLVARWTAASLLRIVSSEETGGWLGAEIDGRVLAFNIGLSIVTGVLFGLLPALRATRTDLVSALRDQSLSARTTAGLSRMRKVMVVAQLALSLILMVGAGLFARSLANLLHLDPGFRTERLLMFSVDPSLSSYRPQQAVAFYRDLQSRLAGLPSVTAVTAADIAPLSGNGRGANVTVEGYAAKEDESTDVSIKTVSAGYFQTLGISMRGGREFNERDDAGAPIVVVVNEEFVRRFFGNRNPLGQRMTFGAGNVKLDHEIVGVVRSTKDRSLRAGLNPFVYTALAQEKSPRGMTFYVRAGTGEDAIAQDVRSVVRSMDSSLPVYNLQSIETQVSQSLRTDRLIAFLAAAFGVLATLLAAVGLYGVVSYVVTRRTNEIGIRMALGASRGNVLGLVMKEVALLAGIGIGIGVPAALALSRLVASQLFGLEPQDPLVFAGAMVSLTMVALAAGFVPARRASRIDPIVALRYE